MNAFILPLVIGAPQIILIVVIILLLFGGRKIPELMRGLGSGIKEFKDASKDDEEEKTVPSDDKKFSEEKK
jgi:sec-independent protein translocase protein TatA